MAKTILDYILPEDQEAYKAIIERAAEAKANAPKAPRKPRGPLTTEQQIARKTKQLEKLKEKLAALMAGETGDVQAPDEE